MPYPKSISNRLGPKHISHNPALRTESNEKNNAAHASNADMSYIYSNKLLDATYDMLDDESVDLSVDEPKEYKNWITVEKDH